MQSNRIISPVLGIRLVTGQLELLINKVFKRQIRYTSKHLLISILATITQVFQYAGIGV